MYTISISENLHNTLKFCISENKNFLNKYGPLQTIFSYGKLFLKICVYHSLINVYCLLCNVMFSMSCKSQKYISAVEVKAKYVHVASSFVPFCGVHLGYNRSKNIVLH